MQKVLKDLCCSKQQAIHCRKEGALGLGVRWRFAASCHGISLSHEPQAAFI